jgi:hypothetical protein
VRNRRRVITGMGNSLLYRRASRFALRLRTAGGLDFPSTRGDRTTS